MRCTVNTLVGLALLLSLAPGARAYSTNSNISTSRSFSATSVTAGQKVTVTLKVTVGAIGSSSLRGLYISEAVPSTLTVSNAKVTLDGSSVTAASETTPTGGVYTGCKTVRWILEKPTSWSENNPVAASSTVVVTYDVTVPSTMTSGTLSFPGMSWVGMIAASGDSGDHFGYEDKAATVTVVAQPKLALSPTSLGFTAQEGGSAPADQDVTVSNGGGGTLGTASAAITYGSAGSGWLTVTQSGSGNSQTLKNSVSLGSLKPNTYSATVKVSSSGAANSPQSYTVSFTVKAKPSTTQPTIDLKPTSLQFTAEEDGASPASQSVAVTNSGAKTLAGVSYTTSYVKGSGWLTVSASGSGNSQSLSNTVSPAGLAADTYTATVAVSSTGASNTPQNYTVSFTVTAKPVTGDSGPAAGDGGAGTYDAAAGGDAGGGNSLAGRNTLEGGCAVGGGAAEGAAGLLLIVLALLALRLGAGVRSRCRSPGSSSSGRWNWSCRRSRRRSR